MVSFKLEATTPSSFISALSDEGKLFIFSSLLDTLRELSWHLYTRYSLASGDTWQTRQQSLSSKRFSKSAHEILRSEMVLSTLNQKACEKLLLTSLLQVPSASCRELSKSFIHYFFFHSYQFVKPISKSTCACITKQWIVQRRVQCSFSAVRFSLFFSLTFWSIGLRK